MTKQRTFPYFLQDFHDQKDFAKAFFIWLEMMDNMQERDNGRKFDGIMHRRRVDLSNWMDFHILLISCLDFLYQCGWRLQRIPKSEVDTQQSIQDFKDLPMVWRAIIYPDEPLTPIESWWRPRWESWKTWHPYMPQTVLDKIKEMEQSNVQSP